MNSILTYVLTYGILLVLFLGLVQFLTNGFFFTFMKVKASRGKKVLVEVRSKLETYSVVGRIEEGFLLYNDVTSKKVEKRIKIPDGAVYRKFNVYCINVDEEENTVILPFGDVVSGFDALKFENLNIRALMSKDASDLTKFVKIILLLLVVVVLAVLFLNYRFMELSSLLESGVGVTGVV